MPAKNLAVLSASLCLSLGSLRTDAELPFARLTSIFPPGGQAGSTVEVTVSGVDLDEAREIVFSSPGITATPKRSAGPGGADTNRFIVSISHGVDCGTYEARVAARYGVTNPRIFTVSDLPEITGDQANYAPAKAVLIPMPTVVNSHAQPARIDYYKVAAQKGQRILFECATREIDSRMEPTLLLDDAEGKELERSRGNGLLDFTAPADGEFLLKVHDSLFRGGNEFWYRLRVGTGPHLDFVVPSAGQPGTKTTFSLYGRNLPGGTEEPGLLVQGKALAHLDVEIQLPATPDPGFVTSWPFKPAAAVVDGFQYRLSATNGTSNPLLIGLTSDPVLTEHEPNNAPEQSQGIETPCEIDGRFFPAGDRDWFTIKASKGEVSWFEIISQRIAWPTSPFLVVRRVGEKNVLGDAQEVYASDLNVGGVDYNTSSRDPAWRFEPKEDGVYKIQVRDLFDSSSSDPHRLYRLRIQSETPDFALIAVPQAPPPPDKDRREARLWTTFLRAGETVPIKVLVLRRGNFGGEIELNAEDLPPGVLAVPAVVESSQSSASLLLTASEAVTDWAGRIRVVGKARLGNSDALRAARSASVVWDVSDANNEAVQSRLTSDFFLSLTGQEAAPASLLVDVDGASGLEGHPGGKLRIPIKIESRSELTGPIKVRAAGLTVMENMKEMEINAKTNHAVLEIDLTQQKLPLGSHHLYLVAQAQTKIRRPSSAKAKAADQKQPVEERQFNFYSPAFLAKVTPAPVTAADGK
jgi:hypothetical protein